MTLEWTNRYPSDDSLRREVAAMVETWVEALLDRSPRSEVAGIYLKGSAQKNWDSPVDYVPELSDVDIHVLFSGSGVFKQIAGSIEDAPAIQSQVEAGYAKKIGSPIHVPRPQVIELNRLMEDPDYCSTPIEAVTTLYGNEYPETGYEDERRLRETARKPLASYAEVTEDLPFSAVDKPGSYMIALHRRMSWRVSPIGPILLLLRGMPWSRYGCLTGRRSSTRFENMGRPSLQRTTAPTTCPPGTTSSPDTLTQRRQGAWSLRPHKC